MVEITPMGSSASSQHPQHQNNQDYELTDSYNDEPSYLRVQPSVSESEQESFMGPDGETTTAAMGRMKKIAHKIYDTTPGINDSKHFIIPDHSTSPNDHLFLFAVYPKKQSKILAGVKHEEQIGIKRAKHFMQNCELIDAARKKRMYGSVADKDLSKCFG